MSGFEIASAVLGGIQMFQSVSGGNAQAAAIKQAGQDQAAIMRYQADVAVQQGIAAKNQATYKAGQAKVAAGQERASAQRSSLEEKRRGRLASSTAVARAAAGGATAEDIYSTLASIGTEAQYNAGIANFQGEDAARGFMDQAALSEYEGNEALRAAKMGANGYRSGADMELSSSRFAASQARSQGYTGAFTAGANMGFSLMSKYAPSKETWANGDRFRT